MRLQDCPSCVYDIFHESFRERPSSPKGEGGIYGTLPRALKTELKVKQVEEGDDKMLKERMELVGSKSPTELGAVTSFSDIPVPNFKSILPERK